MITSFQPAGSGRSKGLKGCAFTWHNDFSRSKEIVKAQDAIYNRECGVEEAPVFFPCVSKLRNVDERRYSLSGTIVFGS